MKLGRWLFPILVMLTESASAASTVQQAQHVRADRYVLRGDGFGSGCPKCEVIATYPNGLRYAVIVERWSDREIEVRLPDLNRGLAVRLAVQSSQGTSTPIGVQLQPQVASPNQLRSLAPGVNVLFERGSELKVGDRGEERIDVSVAAPRCGERAWIFERAELKHLRQRFGEAQIVSRPSSPCIECEPVRVRWYHEPTGHLQFQVSIFRRAIEGVCAERVR